LLTRWEVTCGDEQALTERADAIANYLSAVDRRRVWNRSVEVDGEELARKSFADSDGIETEVKIAEVALVRAFTDESAA
jgi:hypothetical protein